MIYVDTSALVRLFAPEPYSTSVRARLDQQDLVSSTILGVELRHAATKHAVEPAVISDLLSRVSLVPVDQSVLNTAALVADLGCKTLDAIHLASALLVSTEALVTYDERMAVFARKLGIPVEMPGAV